MANQWLGIERGDELMRLQPGVVAGLMAITLIVGILIGKHFSPSRELPNEGRVQNEPSERTGVTRRVFSPTCYTESTHPITEEEWQQAQQEGRIDEKGRAIEFVYASEGAEDDSHGDWEAPDEPSDVVRMFFEACAVDHDYDLARSFWADHVEVVVFTPLDRWPLSQLITAVMQTGEPAYRTLSFHTTNTDGNNATVEVRNQAGECIGDIGGRYSLATIDGVWKIIGS